MRQVVFLGPENLKNEKTLLAGRRRGSYLYMSDDRLLANEWKPESDKDREAGLARKRQRFTDFVLAVRSEHKAWLDFERARAAALKASGEASCVAVGGAIEETMEALSTAFAATCTARTMQAAAMLHLDVATIEGIIDEHTDV